MNGNSCEIVPPPQCLSVHQSKHGNSQLPVGDFASKAAALLGVFSNYGLGYSMYFKTKSETCAKASEAI